MENDRDFFLKVGKIVLKIRRLRKVGQLVWEQESSVLITAQPLKV